MKKKHRRACVLVAVTLAAVPAGAPHAEPGRSKGPVGHDKGTFHAACKSSHLAPADPIVRFGHAGMSHLHEFFGNRSTGATTTPATLRKRPKTTCIRDDEAEGRAGRADSSAYWVPAVYVGGLPVRASQLGAYYSAGLRRFQVIRAFPPGLKVVAGDPTGRTGPEVGGARTYLWECAGPTLVSGTSDVAPTCATPDLRLEVAFPDCWDGRRVDSGDHRSHMAYSQEARSGWACPRSHPVLVPRLKIQIRYPTTGGPLVRLASGPISTTHGDFMNGWNRRELRKLVRRCLNTDKYCGGTDRPVPAHP